MKLLDNKRGLEMNTELGLWILRAMYGAGIIITVIWFAMVIVINEFDVADAESKILVNRLHYVEEGIMEMRNGRVYPGVTDENYVRAGTILGRLQLDDNVDTLRTSIQTENSAHNVFVHPQRYEFLLPVADFHWKQGEVLDEIEPVPDVNIVSVNNKAGTLEHVIITKR